MTRPGTCSRARSWSERANATTVAHTYWNPTSEPTGYVLIMTRQIQSLIIALHSLPRPDEATIAALFEEHASEYLGWP